MTTDNRLKYLPIILNLQDPTDRHAFDRLTSDEGIVKLDKLDDQLKNLMEIRNPCKKLSPSEIKARIREHLQDCSKLEYGSWIYYPWKNVVVHCLPKEEFIEVRTDRNQLKITREEQIILNSKSIGIVGMSFGGQIALTLAMERVFGEIRLADFDTIELKNLNRIHGGITELGIPKTIHIARQIAEIDPYLQVCLFGDRIDINNIDQFFKKPSYLDLVIEECDHAASKLLIRKAAREARIPVIMETNAKPMLDIERFDLEPNRPLLHGRLEDTENFAKDSLIQFVGEEGLTPILKQSLAAMGHTLSGYCQPASTFMIGSGLICEAARQILLGKHSHSGRYIFDIEKILNDQPQSQIV